MAPTRTPTPGACSPTRSTSPSSTPSSPTVCRPRCTSCPRRRSTRPAPRATIVLLAPDLKNEAGALYLRVRDAAVHKGRKILEFTLEGVGPHAARRGARSATSRATQAAAVRTTLADPERGRPAQLRAGRRDRRPRQPRRGRPLHARRPARGALRGARARRCCRSSRAATCAVRSPPGSRRGVAARSRSSRPRAEGKIGTLGAARCRSGQRRARRRPRAPGDCAGARSIIAVDTFLNSSSSKAAASSLLAAAAYAEKAGTTTNIEGRVTASPSKVTPRGTARADWMIAAELAELPRHRPRHRLARRRAGARSAEIDAFAPIADADLGTAQTARCSPRRPAHRTPGRTRPADPQQLRLPPRRRPDAVLRVGGHRAVAVAEATGARRLAARAPARPRRASGSPRATQVTDHQLAHLGGAADRRRRRRAVRGTVWAPFDQPGADIRELIDVTAPVDRRPRGEVGVVLALLDPLLISGHLGSARS